MNIDCVTSQLGTKNSVSSHETTSVPHNVQCGSRSSCSNQHVRQQGKIQFLANIADLDLDCTAVLMQHSGNERSADQSYDCAGFCKCP